MNSRFSKLIPLNLIIGCIFGIFYKNSFSGEILTFSQFSGGANLGWLTENRSTAGMEISYTLVVLTGSLGFERLSEERKYFYSEVCFWMFMNIGMGVGVTASDSSTSRCAHLFMGAPIPIYGMVEGPEKIPKYLIYVEPYWRPIIKFDGWKSIGNEFGVLFKLGYRPL